MKNWGKVIILPVLLGVLIFACSTPTKEKAEVAGSSDYDDLISFYKEFREFQKPKVTDGIPDYTEAAMAEQRHELPKFRSRLAAIDQSEWPISQQVDYHVVGAEMNGFEFEHRVRRPWSRDPGFYLMSWSGAYASYDPRY